MQSTSLKSGLRSLLLSSVLALSCSGVFAADAPSPAQMAEAEKVAHSYVQYWMAGDYKQAIALADHGNVSITGVRCAEQLSKYNVINDIISWGKSEVVGNEYVAVPFSANTTKADGTKRKQDWWIGLVNDGGAWRVFYANANNKPLTFYYVEHKSATQDDGQPQFEYSLKSFKQKVADAQKK